MRGVLGGTAYVKSRVDFRAIGIRAKSEAEQGKQQIGTARAAKLFPFAK